MALLSGNKAFDTTDNSTEGSSHRCGYCDLEHSLWATLESWTECCCCCCCFPTSDMNRDRGTGNPLETVPQLEDKMTKRKWQKDSQPLLKEKTEENLRGVHFCVFWFCFSERASCFCFCFVTAFALWEWKRRCRFYGEGWNRPLEDSVLYCFFLVRSSFIIFPLLNSEMTFEQGLLTGILESQREVGQGEIRKPAALPRIKISMALNCLNISKSNTAWGEKHRREASSPTPPSRAEEASGNI